MEHDGGWLDGRRDADWAKVSDSGSSMEEREVDLSDLEMDLSK